MAAKKQKVWKFWNSPTQNCYFLSINKKQLDLISSWCQSSIKYFTMVTSSRPVNLGFKYCIASVSNSSPVVHPTIFTISTYVIIINIMKCQWLFISNRYKEPSCQFQFYVQISRSHGLIWACISDWFLEGMGAMKWEFVAIRNRIIDPIADISPVKLKPGTLLIKLYLCKWAGMVVI